MLYKHKEIKKSDIQLKDKTFYHFKIQNCKRSTIFEQYNHSDNL